MSHYTRRCALQLLRELGVPVPSPQRGGRPHKLTPVQQTLALQRLARGDRQCDVARDFGVHRQTLCRLQRRARLLHVKHKLK
jgi:transposase